MSKFAKILLIVINVTASLLLALSILSIFRNTTSKFFKLLDFPRIQMFLTAMISLGLYLFLKKTKWKWYNYFIVAGLAVAMVIQSFFLIHYTVLVPVEVKTVEKITAADVPISMLIINVEMSNRESKPLIKLIENKQPDLILAMEVDMWWENQLETIRQEYPYTQKMVNEVTYGMILYSKLPLKKIDVNYLNNPKVPSFETEIILPQGKRFILYSVHPVPPTHFADLPDNAGEKEIAMKKLGNRIVSKKLPAVVAGDINDVVWSYVDELTGTKDILYDLRVGRGFYNSYNAKNILMRWPLDHVFVTKEFQLQHLQILPDIGSDHYPLYVELVLKSNN